MTIALQRGTIGNRADAVVPRVIHTLLPAMMFEDPENAKCIRAVHLIGRLGQPEAVAVTTVSPLSAGASFTSGVTLLMDTSHMAVLAS